MRDSRAWTRPRFLLALLLAALVTGAVSVRPPTARGKGSVAAAWRASARPAAPQPDLGPGAAPALPSVAPEPLPVARILGAEAPAGPRLRLTAPPFAQSPLPRAPPVR